MYYQMKGRERKSPTLDWLFCSESDLQEYFKKNGMICCDGVKCKMGNFQFTLIPRDIT